MTKAAAIALATFLSTSALAQTSSTTRKPVAHRSATSAATTTRTAVNPADNPPNVPRIVGTPRPLYALRYVDTIVGTGELSKPNKFYSVRYTGWLTNGTKFDSSDDHPGKEPISFPYGARRVIPGWDTGFEGMRIGGKRRLYIPFQLAYGEAGRPPVIPARADLIFDLELVAMTDAPPADPNVPPANPSQPSQPSDPPKPATPPVDPTKPTSTSPPASSNSPASSTPTAPSTTPPSTQTPPK